MTMFFWNVLLPTLGTRFLGGKMIRVLIEQTGIDRPGHHPPGLMTKPFDFRKCRIARRSVLTKTSPHAATPPEPVPAPRKLSPMPDVLYLAGEPAIMRGALSSRSLPTT